MANSKATKKALVTSMLSLLLCFTMLMGTTFAWFTDTVKSVNNIIKSGNLDIDVQYTLDGESWNDLDGAGDLFQKGLWEPGHTEVVALKITNSGSLALKYTANMNIVDEAVGKAKDGEDIVLSDILTVSTLTQQAVDADGNQNLIGDITLGLAFDSENSIAYQNTATFKDANVLGDDVELHPGAAHYLIVKVDMAETVTNEANHNGTDIPAINFGINVLATQFTYENDSFGPDYDEEADYFVEATNAADVAAIFTSGGTLAINEPLTLNGGLTVNADVTLTEGEIENPTTSYVFSVNSGTLTVDALDYEGSAGLRVNGGDLVINDGTYHIAGNNSSSRHTLYVAEGKVVINGGTFTRANNATDGYKRGATIYAAEGTEVIINGGSFAEGHARTGNIVGGGSVTIYGGTFEFDPAKWLATGYTATKGADGVWTVAAVN